MTSISYDRTDVFISYSHKDAQYLERLKTHFAFDERRGSLSVWEDTRLLPGTQWRAEIEKAIKKTRIAILLVSADFLASKFIAENELPPLLAAAKTEGAIIIPVILSACAFQRTALAQFQAVNDPSKPIGRMRKVDREEKWAEIVTRVDLELSKASEHKLDWTLGPTDDTLGPTDDDLRKLLDWPRSMDVRKITPARPLSVESSAVAYLSKLFQGNETADYAIIDIGTGQKWLISRLYIFAIMLERMRGLRCFVFLETSGEVDQRFLGIASPREVRWALARRYPWLEVAFAKAYSYATDPDSGIEWIAYDPKFGILSATGALDLGLAQAVVYEFLTRIQQTSTGTPSTPDDGEWEFFTTEDGQQLWEHAKWTRPQQDLGEVLQQDESTWVIESPDISHTELARSILRCKSPFVALVDEEKKFKSLIDRQDLLERTVANQ